MVVPRSNMLQFLVVCYKFWLSVHYKASFDYNCVIIFGCLVDLLSCPGWTTNHYLSCWIWLFVLVTLSHMIRCSTFFKCKMLYYIENVTVWHSTGFSLHTALCNRSKNSHIDAVNHFSCSFSSKTEPVLCVTMFQLVYMYHNDTRFLEPIIKINHVF